MSNLIKRSHLEFLFVAVVLTGSVLFLAFGPAPKGRVYDCSLSEISPDYPLEVKNECRKLRAEKIK